jgi:hypothetical protein
MIINPSIGFIMINIPVRIRNGMDDHKPYLKIGKVRAESSYRWAELTSTRTLKIFFGKQHRG